MHTLNSGIRLVGSSSGRVSRLALPSPPKWKGRNTVSVRMSSSQSTTASTAPRLETTRAGSPSDSPAAAATTGWTCTRASGSAATSSAIRLVWAPDW